MSAFRRCDRCRMDVPLEVRQAVVLTPPGMGADSWGYRQSYALGRPGAILEMDLCPPCADDVARFLKGDLP